MSRVGFEPTIPVFERLTRVRPLDLAAILPGLICYEKENTTAVQLSYSSQNPPFFIQEIRQFSDLFTLSNRH
jgi:hypothetical protein